MPARVEVLVEAAAWEEAGLPALAQRAAEATFAHLGLSPDAFAVSLLACSDDRIADLNAAFRGKASPTNVLAWPSAERGAEMPGAVPAPPLATADAPCELGDIALAHGICAAEAAALARPLAEHATHLVVHGTLHLLGYDHADVADAALMERLETEILASMGLPDPY